MRISGPDIGTKTALTDAQGRYEFRELPAGRFNVSVSKSGFVTMQYGQNRPYEPGRPIELAEAQKMDKADVSLPRGSVLAGRVVDEFGEAVAEAEVTAMRMQFMNGKRRLTPSGRNGTTNDLGPVPDLRTAPGEYYVSATLRNMNMMVMDMMGGGVGGPSGSNQSSGYAATYYPSTPIAGRRAAHHARRRPGARERRHPAPAREAREDHRHRDRLRRQADVGRDGDADARDEGRHAVHAGRHVANRQGRQLHARAA